jgi:putative SOS response-associated peptidase YedK
MCGRYTIRALQPIVDMFGLALPDDFPARYNVAPTEDVPVVRAGDAGAGGDSASAGGGDRRLDLLHWGLVPSWAEDPSVGNRMINARAETAATRPAFRDAMRRRRCLVVADGFYEWKKLPPAAGLFADALVGGVGKGKAGAVRKQPYLFRMKGDKPFAFAGLWDTWRREGKKLESFTILTTSPNELIAPVHDRMPVIVAPEDYARWLDPKRNATDVQDLLRPYPAEAMEAFPVSTRVNSPANDDAGCTEREEAWE